MPIISRSTLRRPSASDIQPESTRPAALPTAPTTRLMVTSAALGRFMLLANGTSWLITISPAAHPSAYAIHIYHAVGVRHIWPGVNSYVVAADLAAGAGVQPSGR